MYLLALHMGRTLGTISETDYHALLAALREIPGKLDNTVIDVSGEIDDIIARRKLAAWGIEIDSLTPEQQKYLNSWKI